MKKPAVSPQIQWRKRNPEKWAAIVERYKSTGKIQKYQKAYYEKNKERINKRTRERAKARRLREGDVVRERDRRWAVTITGRWQSYIKNARNASREFLLSFDEFKSLWQKNCFYCDSPIKTIGLDRVDNTQGYTLTNVVPCCKMCNRMKADTPQNDFFEHIQKNIPST